MKEQHYRDKILTKTTRCLNSVSSGARIYYLAGKDLFKQKAREIAREAGLPATESSGETFGSQIELLTSASKGKSRPKRDYI